MSARLCSNLQFEFLVWKIYVENTKFQHCHGDCAMHKTYFCVE